MFQKIIVMSQQPNTRQIGSGASIRGRYTINTHEKKLATQIYWGEAGVFAIILPLSRPTHHRAH